MKKKLFALLLSLSIISLLVGGYALAENKPVVAADINSETLMVTLTSEDLMGDEEIEACGKHWLPNWEEQDGVWSTSFQMPDCDFTLYWVDQEWTLLSDLLSEHDGWVHYEGEEIKIFLPLVVNNH